MSLLLDPTLHPEDALRHRHTQRRLLLQLLRARRLALLPFPHLSVEMEPAPHNKVNMVLNVHRNHKAYLGRVEGRKGGVEVGGKGDDSLIAIL